MKLFPAIDLIDGCAVRLVRGDYNQKTIYSRDPVSVAKQFEEDGAEYLHVVDLEGARDGTTANFKTIQSILQSTKLHVEVGGGIRSEDVIKKYVDTGVLRVILGTAAITQPEFLAEMADKYGKKIAVGVDIKDGYVAIKGWTQVSNQECFTFCEGLEQIGIKTVICTDISKDGVLAGTNMELYQKLSQRFSMDFVASGGISAIQDVKRLKDMGMYGAILGKALYTGSLCLKDAVMLCREGNK